MRLHHAGRPALIATLAILLMLGGFAIARAADTSTNVRVCVNKKTRVMTLPKAKCPRGTSTKLLSQTGPIGATGATGRVGTAGLPGEPGGAEYVTWTWEFRPTTGQDPTDVTGSLTSAASGPALVMPVSVTLADQQAVSSTCTASFYLSVNNKRVLSYTGSTGEWKTAGLPFTPLAEGASYPLDAYATCRRTDPFDEDGRLITPPSFDATTLLGLYPLDLAPTKIARAF